ncbi:hypothetical protein BH10PSE15_BH10PSE15_11400 [soil metagenome]
MKMGFVANFESLKNMVAPAGELGRSILHIHLGLAIYIVARLATPRGRGPLWALGVLALLETLNEVMDLAATWPILQRWQIRDTEQDMFNTMLWPCLLCALTLWDARRARAGRHG